MDIKEFLQKFVVMIRKSVEPGWDGKRKTYRLKICKLIVPQSKNLIISLDIDFFGLLMLNK